MRLVIQRVKKASVKVGETKKVVGKIEKGILVLIGVAGQDTKKDAEVLAEKLARLRIMADKNGKMNLSVSDVDASVLAVSQFTLYADTSAGNRPSFIKAADPATAEEIYEYFVSKLRELGVRLATGKFGAYMQIDACLDGPVTLLLES